VRDFERAEIWEGRGVVAHQSSSARRARTPRARGLSTQSRWKGAEDQKGREPRRRGASFLPLLQARSTAQRSPETEHPLAAHHPSNTQPVASSRTLQKCEWRGAPHNKASTQPLLTEQNEGGTTELHHQGLRQQPTRTARVFSHKITTCSESKYQVGGCSVRDRGVKERVWYEDSTTFFINQSGKRERERGREQTLLIHKQKVRTRATHQSAVQNHPPTTQSLSSHRRALLLLAPAPAPAPAAAALGLGGGGGGAAAGTRRG